MSMLRLTLIANDPLVRSGLAAMLSAHPDVDVVGQFTSDDIERDLEDDEVESVDALVWDVGWNGAERPFNWEEFPFAVVALVPEDSDSSLFWQYGAKALLLRDASVEQIVTAVKAATENLRTFDPTLSPHPPASQLPPLDIKEELTPREQEVIQLLAQGMTNKAIAHQLEISENTVKFHVTAIMTKLEAQSRTDAVVRATRLGLILL